MKRNDNKVGRAQKGIKYVRTTHHFQREWGTAPIKLTADLFFLPFLVLVFGYPVDTTHYPPPSKGCPIVVVVLRSTCSQGHKKLRKTCTTPCGSDVAYFKPMGSLRRMVRRIAIGAGPCPSPNPDTLGIERTTKRN